MEDVGDADVLARLKRQEMEEREEIERELKVHKELLQRAEAVQRQRESALGPVLCSRDVCSPPTMVPLGQSYTSPGPVSSSMASSPPSNPSPASAQAHSSDNPQTWSFEEQFKQVGFNS